MTSCDRSPWRRCTWKSAGAGTEMVVVMLIAAQDKIRLILTYQMRDHVIGGWNAERLTFQIPIPSLHSCLPSQIMIPSGSITVAGTWLYLSLPSGYLLIFMLSSRTATFGSGSRQTARPCLRHYLPRRRRAFYARTPLNDLFLCS